MIELKPITAFLQGLPETTAMAAVVCALIDCDFDWRRISAVGVLQVITIYLMRLLPVTFGIHLFFGVFTLAFYSQLIIKDNFARVIISSILTYLMISILETAIHIPVLKALSLSQLEASHDIVFWILMGWPQVIALFGIAFLIRRLRTRNKASDSKGGL